jgi:hypothetical protein
MPMLAIDNGGHHGGGSDTIYDKAPSARCARGDRGPRPQQLPPYYDDLVELARICLEQSREAKNPFVSEELRHVARDTSCAPPQ